MISSIDLFFNRDCGGGGGPVDAPRLALLVCAASAAGAEVAGSELAAADVPGGLFFSRVEISAAVETGAAEVVAGRDGSPVEEVAPAAPEAAAGCEGLPVEEVASPSVNVAFADCGASVPGCAPAASEVTAGCGGLPVASRNMNLGGADCEAPSPFPAPLKLNVAACGVLVDAAPVVRV